jgi:HEAT repeat protein
MPRSIPILLALLLICITGCADTATQLGNSTNQFFRFLGRASDAATGKTARKAAVRMEDQYFPDERREGINDLVKRDFGKREPYIKRYEQIAQNDPDWLVRATAIRALNRSRHSGSTPIFVKALSDPNEQVRLEACKALVHMPDENAITPLVRLVQTADENRDVRIAAAEALQHYRTLEVARALANTLAGRDFGLAYQAHQTLTLITGRDLRYDEAAWLAYLTGPEKPFG